MLKVNVKIDYKEARVEGYGVIRVRPLGAGEELELTMLQEELTELKAPLDELEGADDNEETRKALKETAEKMSKTVDKIHEIMSHCVSSEDPKIAERLVKELPMVELSRICTEILKNA